MHKTDVEMLILEIGERLSSEETRAKVPWTVASNAHFSECRGNRQSVSQDI